MCLEMEDLFHNPDYETGVLVVQGQPVKGAVKPDLWGVGRREQGA